MNKAQYGQMRPHVQHHDQPRFLHWRPILISEGLCKCHWMQLQLLFTQWNDQSLWGGRKTINGMEPGSEENFDQSVVWIGTWLRIGAWRAAIRQPDPAVGGMHAIRVQMKSIPTTTWLRSIITTPSMLKLPSYCMIIFTIALGNFAIFSIRKRSTVPSVLGFSILLLNYSFHLNSKF